MIVHFVILFHTPSKLFDCFKFEKPWGQGGQEHFIQIEVYSQIRDWHCVKTSSTVSGEEEK